MDVPSCSAFVPGLNFHSHQSKWLMRYFFPSSIKDPYQVIEFGLDQHTGLHPLKRSFGTPEKRSVTSKLDRGWYFFQSRFAGCVLITSVMKYKKKTLSHLHSGYRPFCTGCIVAVQTDWCCLAMPKRPYRCKIRVLPTQLRSGLIANYTMNQLFMAIGSLFQHQGQWYQIYKGS